MDVYIAEFLGTAILILLGDGVVANVLLKNSKGEASGWIVITFGWGMAVAMAVFTVGSVSGAHINPAVTLGLWSVGRFPTRDVLPYVAAQCAGAVAASWTMRGILGPVGGMGATIPAISVGGAFAVEFLLSFVLMTVVMAVATDERVAPGSGGLAAGLTVGFCAMVGGPMTGASMNPARSLGPALAGGPWDAHWLYWVAPITAMLVAARVYDWMRPARMPDVVPRAVLVGTEGPVRGG